MARFIDSLMYRLDKWIDYIFFGGTR